MRQWGTAGNAAGQFNLPGDISVNHFNGHVYVADTGNNRIQEFTHRGQFVREWGTAGSGDGQLNSPYGIKVALLPHHCRK